MITDTKLAMGAPSAGMLSVPEAGKFRTIVDLQQIFGSFHVTSDPAVTIVEEDFAHVSTLTIVVNFDYMLLLKI